jgi:hypothetical protein
MELTQIREILSGLRVPVEVRRQAWIEYGRRLAQCPYTQRRQVGEWVRKQGLDFVEDGNERSAARRLANFMINHDISLDGCQLATPSRVIAWLQDSGQIEVRHREPCEAQDDGQRVHVASIDRVALANFARSFVESGGLTAISAGATTETIVGTEQYSVEHGVHIPMAASWGHHDQARMIGVRFRVVAEPFWYDVTRDADGNLMPVIDRPATFGQAEFTRAADGVTPDTARQLLGEA